MSRHPAADDEPETFGSYGVRVPALIVSPWVEPRTVSSTVFDHTSIIKTILLRFCPEALHDPPPGSKEATQDRRRSPIPGPARGAGQPSRGTPDPPDATTRPTARRPAAQAAARAAHAETSQPRPGGPGPGGHPPNDLQRSILAAAHELSRRGHPSNTS